jgi:hypothetical protein
LRETPPVAVCTQCGDFTCDAAQINNKCAQQPGGKRCKGVYGSALNKDDWKKCGRCNNTGQMFGAPCLACQGSGWCYVRKIELRHYPWPLSLVLKHRY